MKRALRIAAWTVAAPVIAVVVLTLWTLVFVTGGLMKLGALALGLSFPPPWELIWDGGVGWSKRQKDEAREVA